MIKISMTLEDLEVQFVRDKGSWTLHVSNAFAEDDCILEGITDSEVGAITALAAGLGEDNVDAIGTKWLYKIALPVAERLPDSLRLIP